MQHEGFYDTLGSLDPVGLRHEECETSQAVLETYKGFCNGLHVFHLNSIILLS